MLKRVKFVCLASLMLLIGILCACAGGAKMVRAPFHLNLSDPFQLPKVTFLKDLNTFELFLSNVTVFEGEPSEELVKINQKYDSKYFETNDLAALIIWANSGKITGYQLKDVKEENEYWNIKLHSRSKGQLLTTDMGEFFCFYVELPKNDAMKEVRLEFV